MVIFIYYYESKYSLVYLNKLKYFNLNKLSKIKPRIKYWERLSKWLRALFNYCKKTHF